MRRRRVLLASLTNRDDEALRLHVASVRALEVPEGVELDFAYILDGVNPDVFDGGWVETSEATPKAPEATYAVSEQTHHWSLPMFEWMAHERQRLLDYAVSGGYDYVFLVDSDLVLGAETLLSLLSCERDVVSANFWTRWQAGAPEMPQTWLRHPYGLEGRSGSFFFKEEEFLRRLRGRELVEVLGLGACTLMSTRVLDFLRYFPLLDGLPSDGMWQGEDRHFCVRAQRAHVPLFADGWPDVFHIYRPSDVEAAKAWTPPKRKTKASFGDFVSFTLEPLEEPELVKIRPKEHLRGRLGQLRLLPEIEEALETTCVGEERIVSISFPSWWELKEVRGRTKKVLLKVVDVKERG